MMSIELSEDEFARSEALTGKIKERIRSSQEQSIPFSEFMNLSLYEAELGYYCSSTHAIGTQGDFVTAPELGNLFATALTKKIIQIFKQFSGPRIIYEFGAGTGKLAIQILDALSSDGFAIDQYVIVEVSPALKSVQKKRLSTAKSLLREKVTWCNRFPIQHLTGIILLNEVLDAMPVELIRIHQGRLYQGYVCLVNSDLTINFVDNVNKDLLDHFHSLKLPAHIYENYFSEVHTQASAWLKTVANCLDLGSILICDYGFPQFEYYHPDRRQGTLVCHRRHHLIFDPLINIGCQDISSHINFTILADIATESGLLVNGFTSLAAFVVDTALATNSNSELLATGSKELFTRKQEILTLTSAAEMGDIFKVMELTKDIEPEYLGFSFSDHRHRLYVEM